MDRELANNTVILKKRLEFFREELNTLTARTERYYKNNEILKLSTDLDEMIVQYMKILYSAKH